MGDLGVALQQNPAEQSINGYNPAMLGERQANVQCTTWRPGVLRFVPCVLFPGYRRWIMMVMMWYQDGRWVFWVWPRGVASRVFDGT